MTRRRVVPIASRRLFKLGAGASGLALVATTGYIIWKKAYGTNGKTGTKLDQDDIAEFIGPSGVPPVRMDPSEAKAELTSMIPRHLRKPWKLLKQANSRDYEKHLLAVRELAKLDNLSEGDLRQLAQCCERNTSIGLARTDGVDLRFLLPPPPLLKDMTETPIPKLFKKILSELPNEDIHECIRFFTAKALDNYVPWTDEDQIRDTDLEGEFSRDSHHLLSIPRSQYSESKLIEVCLQALLSHSTVHSHCQKMIEFRCLQIFQRVIRDHPKNPFIKSLIGKILANMSLYQDTHSNIFASGWVGFLAKWKQDPNLLVHLPAAKALANLDHYYTDDLFYPGIYILLPETRHVRHLNELSNVGVDIVFIHGLLGGVFYSWRQLDKDNTKGWGTPILTSTEEYSYCWPKDWLRDVSDHIRVLGVDFDSYLSQWGNSCPNESFQTSLKERSREILRNLKACGVGQRPVIFVGHSMGGLIIKQMLDHASHSAKAQDQGFVSNTKGIVFYSTPHAGSMMAKLKSYTKYVFFPTAEVQDLEFGSKQLKALHDSFVDIVKANGIEVISFGETRATPYLGMDLVFVPPSSSDPGIGKHYPVDMNHMNICKPANKSSILFRKLLKLVWSVMDDITPTQ